MVNCGGSGVSEGVGPGEPLDAGLGARWPRRGRPLGVGLDVSAVAGVVGAAVGGAVTFGAAVATGIGASGFDPNCASPAVAVASPRTTAKPMPRRRRLKFTWYASPERVCSPFVEMAAGDEPQEVMPAGRDPLAGGGIIGGL